jgi:hypothetical protein
MVLVRRTKCLRKRQVPGNEAETPHVFRGKRPIIFLLLDLRAPFAFGILLQRGIAIFGSRSRRPSWAFPP